MLCHFASVLSSRALRHFSRRGVGPVNSCWLTMRAPDLGYAPRFLACFWLAPTPVSRANPPSHPKRVTQAVRRTNSKATPAFFSAEIEF